MQITALLTFAGLAAAQTLTSSASVPTGTGGSCQAQNILEACLSSTKATLQSCGPNDYSCLCNKYTDILTCYNNCPSDSGRFGIEQSKLSYCNSAKQFTSTSSSAYSAVSTSSSMATMASSATGSRTGTAAAASATKTGGAVAVALPAGGLLAAVAGVMGALL